MIGLGRVLAICVLIHVLSGSYRLPAIARLLPFHCVFVAVGKGVWKRVAKRQVTYDAILRMPQNETESVSGN